MKHYLRYLHVLSILFMVMAKVAIGSNGENSKDLPSGWGYSPTGGSHLIAITTDVVFNCINLTQGDYIGLFYTNDQGSLSCGGALAWVPGQSQVIAAYGDDFTTVNVKDGFAENEPLTWKVYYHQTGTEQFVLVSYNTNMTNFNGLFQTNGVSALVSMLNPIGLTAGASPMQTCAGDQVQLSAVITGGCGTPVYSWSSTPEGFTSNEASPFAYPLVSTIYTVVVTNQYGDSQTKSVSVAVNPLPQVTCSQSMSACEDELPVLLNAATPQGGVYSGAGVFASEGSYYFDPAVGPGNYQISYCYTESATDCENCCEFTFIVNPLPEVVCPDDFTVCIYTEPFVLEGATPSGGDFSGNGVIGGIFDPLAAGGGDHLITYNYNNPQTGCGSYCEFTITVIEVEVECPSGFALCVDAEPVILTGGLPDGGTYAGSGVTAGVFYPVDAGAGLHVLTYTWVYPGTNCFATCEFTVEVYPLPQVTCPQSMSACVDEFPVLLNAATPQGGVYSGAGVFASEGSYYFDPAVGPGNYQISYCYTESATDCENCCEFTFIVNPLPEVVCPDDFTVCIYTEPFVLEGATPSGGDFSGNGVIGGIFDPLAAGGGDHLITYNYNNPQTGCGSYCEFTITVIEVEVECPSGFALCVDAEPVILTGGLPDGGTYAGSGVTAGVFYPVDAGAGLHVLTYTWVYPGTNCFATCEFTVEVYPLPQMICPDSFEVCLASEDVLLNQALPQGGIYSGTGMQFSNGSYYFEPWVGTGDYTITYCYTDPTTGCSDCCEFIISVIADQVIDIPTGWSGISSYISPTNPNLTDLLYPITYPLIILNNFSGVYWPGGNTFTLENWDPYSGYVIKSSWDTQLPVCGDEVQNKTVNLNQGWNLMPVLSTENISIVDLFAGVAGFQIAKEVAGTGIYWPEYGINTIGAVKPGKAYYVKMTAAGSVDF